MPEATLVVGLGGLTTTAKPRSLFTLPLTIISAASNRPAVAHLKTARWTVTCGERNRESIVEARLRSRGLHRTRTDRIVLGVEVIFGVLPISVVGGLYALLGIVFGVTSVLVSISQHSLSASMFWLAVLGIALGGLVGITGLWLLVLVSELGGTPQVRRAALIACGIGIATAFIALTLAIRQDGGVPLLTVYLLLSPVIVVCERLSRTRSSPSA